jgi:hypothetical protein
VTAPGSPSSTPYSSSVRRARWVVVPLVLGVSLVLGGVTSGAQGFLPDALRPLANSASGWTLLTAVTVWATRRQPPVAVVLGALSFVGLVIGYSLVSNVRGSYFDPLFWSLVGVVVGPFVGTAAAWLRSSGWRRAVGTGLLSGIAVGDGGYGLTVVSDTTGWFYWAAAIVVGLSVAVVSAITLAAGRWIALELGAVVLVALALNLTYRLLLG